MVTYSISVPVGAYHELLPACLNSLSTQNGDLRVSLLDASGDRRVSDLADQFAGILAYRRHGPDKGQSDAIIEGWTNADGDVLGWLNADDFLYPGALERVSEIFERDRAVDVVSGHSAICDRQGALTGYHWAVEPPGEAILSGCVISQPSCFFRRSLYDAVGGLDRSLHYTMDWDLWIRFYRNAAKFAFLDEPLSVVYWGEGTKTIGMNKTRRLELDRLVSAHTPPGKKFRARRGFFLRAMLDNFGSVKLKSAIEDALRRKKPSVFGLGPNGAIGKQATIFLPYLGDRKAAAIELKIDGSENIEASMKEARSVRRDQGVIRLELQEPPKEARVFMIALRTVRAAKARLLSCRTVDE